MSENNYDDIAMVMLVEQIRAASINYPKFHNLLSAEVDYLNTKFETERNKSANKKYSIKYLQDYYAVFEPYYKRALARGNKEHTEVFEILIKIMDEIEEELIKNGGEYIETGNI